MNMLLLGPYIGSFFHEITVFRPYIRYITSVSDCDDVYISSHSNRSFLYNWIKPDNFIPIHEYLTREEGAQVGYMHDDITKSEYNQLIKRIKTSIDGNVTNHTLPYIKSTNTIPFQQKEYSKFDFPDIDLEEEESFIILIPDKSEEMIELYNQLKKRYNVIVIGDMSNGLEQENVILKRYDYFTNNYEVMFNYIHKAKMVVTPCSQWALICNQQHLPLFYWGMDGSMYKPDGVYGFSNPNALSMRGDATDASVLIDYHWKKLNGE